MNKTICSVDPGSKGGIAYILAGTAKPVAYSMPETQGDILDSFRALACGSDGERIAFLEQVGGYIQGNAAPGSAMFNFGENFGFVKGVLMALGFRLEMVRPQHWQKALMLGTAGVEKGDSKSVKAKKKRDFKNRMKEHAQRLYPDVKVTLNTADALLLLEYGKQASR